MPEAVRKFKPDFKDSTLLCTLSRNLDVYLELIGSNITSFALRVDISAVMLIGYGQGLGALNEDLLEAICSEAGLTAEQLLYNYGSMPATKRRLGAILKEQGRITADTLLGHPEPQPSAAPATDKLPVVPATNEPVSAEVVPLMVVADEDETREEVPMLNTADEHPIANDDQPVPETALTWDDGGLVATVEGGTRSFDLKSKDLRREIAGRIRTLKGDMSFSQLFEKAGVGKPSGWLNGVENGQSRIYRAELERFATALNVSVYALLDGANIKITPSGRSTATMTKEVIEIPNVGPDEMQDFFRQRVLSKRTEPSEGTTIGDLLELAANPDQVDWLDAFLRLTKDGAALNHDIEHLVKALSSKHRIVQNIMLRKLAEKLKSAE